MEFKRGFVLVLALIFIIFTGYFYSNKALSFRFVDEEDNFVFGKYLVKREKLYDDLISNHQPLTFILSAAIQDFTDPNSVFLLLNRHRQALIVWSVVWSLGLIYYFGIPALIFVILFELTKIYILGNLFLAESLVVYPFIFLIGLTLFLQRRLSKAELFLYGECLGLAAFLLSPIWPSLIFCASCLIFKERKNLASSLIFILAGFSIPAFVVFTYSSLAGYVYYLFVNLTYTVPAYHTEPFFITLLKSLLSPVLLFLPNSLTPTLWVIRILSLLLIFNLIRSNTKILKKALLIFIILGLSNLRFIQPGTEGYAGFHILPWYGAFIFVCLMLYSINKVNLLSLVLLILLTLNFARTGLFLKVNKQHDYYINYSTFEDLGRAIKIMKSLGDTLIVSPNAWLIYWNSDIDHLPKLYGDYTWIAGFPPLHNKVLQAFEKNPPTFFYCGNCGGLDLGKYLFKYKEIKKSGGHTMLYVLEGKAQNLNSEQINRLNYYNFSF